MYTQHQVRTYTEKQSQKTNKKAKKIVFKKQKKYEENKVEINQHAISWTSQEGRVGVKHKNGNRWADWLRYISEKLEKLDDELSERLFGNYNLLEMKMVFTVSILIELWIIWSKSSLIAKV